MAPQDSPPTCLSEYSAFLLPWAHGHPLKALGDFVAAIIEQQTACQAQLARSCGNQEAAVKGLSRLLHHERLAPRLWADAVLWQALHQWPKHGTVRLAMDWTIEADQPLLVVSLVVGRRAVPMSWRAYDASVFKGRRKRYAWAVIRRAVGRVARAVGTRRVIVTADRGFAAVGLLTFLSQWGVTFLIRGHAGPHVFCQGKWRQVGCWRFRGNERHRSFGALPYGERCPQRLWVSKSRARDAQGHWGLGHVVSHRPLAAPAAANEYGRRCGCAEGWRDAQWWRGVTKARRAQLTAWSRMCALFAMAVLVMTSVGSKLLLAQGQRAQDVLRRVVSRRRGRCALGLVRAMVRLLQRDKTL